MYNNNVGWGWLPAACIPYKKEGSIYFEPDRDVYFGEDANEGSAAMYQLLCDTLKDGEKTNKEETKMKKRQKEPGS